MFNFCFFTEFKTVLEINLYEFYLILFIFYFLLIEKIRPITRP